MQPPPSLTSNPVPTARSSLIRTRSRVPSLWNLTFPMTRKSTYLPHTYFRYFYFITRDSAIFTSLPINAPENEIPTDKPD